MSEVKHTPAALQAAHVVEAFQKRHALSTTELFAARFAAAELRRLHAVNQALLQELNNIATADWRSWDKESRSPAAFVGWAKSRARQAIAQAGGEQPC